MAPSHFCSSPRATLKQALEGFAIVAHPKQILTVCMKPRNEVREGEDRDEVGERLTGHNHHHHQTGIPFCCLEKAPTDNPHLE
jgi:hypothetical protein